MSWLVVANCFGGHIEDRAMQTKIFVAEEFTNYICFILISFVSQYSIPHSLFHGAQLTVKHWLHKTTAYVHKENKVWCLNLQQIWWTPPRITAQLGRQFVNHNKLLMVHRTETTDPSQPTQ